MFDGGAVVARHVADSIAVRQGAAPAQKINGEATPPVPEHPVSPQFHPAGPQKGIINAGKENHRGACAGQSLIGKPIRGLANVVSLHALSLKVPLDARVRLKCDAILSTS
ncbi:MAG: hypothetical protein AB7P23_00130 [Amphiplicatus sp.]